MRRGAAASASAAGEPRTDYDAEARAVFQREDDDYRDVDLVWEDPETWAKLFVGNADFAASKEQLLARGIRHVVNCQEEDSHNAHEADPEFAYLRFPIARWPCGAVEEAGGDKAVVAYMRPLFDWVDDRLRANCNVLVHCLAGAHRAGTASIAYVMHRTGMEARSAWAMVQARRCCVEPIFDFADLLRMLEPSLCTGRVPQLDAGDGTGGLEGTWVYNQGRSRYRIYATKPGHAEDTDPGHRENTELCFWQPLANGELHGVLQRTEAGLGPPPACKGESQWAWEAHLSNGARIRFRRDGQLLMSSYLQTGASSWLAPRYAERLNS